MTIVDGTDRSSTTAEKLAPQVARRLEEEIIRRGWPVGELLGSETELRERFGVSRSVLREAVRLLEHHRIAQMQRGPGGGLVVRAPDASPATRALVIYLEYVGTSIADMLGARLLLEPLAAGLVAETVTEQEISQLRAVVSGERRPAGTPDRSADGTFHILLGQLSGNPVLQLFVEVLTRLTFEYARSTGRLPKSDLETARANAVTRHLAVIDALLAGDAAAARTGLIAHFGEIEGWLATHRSRPADQRMRTRPADPDPDVDEGRKRAEIIAGLIHDDIAAEGQNVGDVFGSETELLARYTVSRAVLREAVAILEHHSVAQMRRGHGGGLVVLAPDPTASFHTIGLYLHYRGLLAGHLSQVREVLELGSAQAVARAGLTREGTSRLRATLRHEGSGRLFHTELAELTGNPVLTLFLRIVIQLRTDAGLDAPAGPQAEDDRRAHELILEAVLAGDSALARHRIVRHLRTHTACW